MASSPRSLRLTRTHRASASSVRLRMSPSLASLLIQRSAVVGGAPVVRLSCETVTVSPS